MPRSLYIMIPAIRLTSRMRFVVPDVWDKSTLTRSQRRELAKQQQAVYEAYKQHQDAMRAILPHPLCTLLDLPLDDASMTLIAIDRLAPELRLHLYHSTPEHGNFNLRLHFQGARLFLPDMAVLRQVARQGRKADVMAIELDVAQDGESHRFVCRFQWHTQRVVHRDRPAGIFHTYTPEIEFCFDDLTLELTQQNLKVVSPRCLFRLR